MLLYLYAYRRIYVYFGPKLSYWPIVYALMYFNCKHLRNLIVASELAKQMYSVLYCAHPVLIENSSKNK